MCKISSQLKLCTCAVKHVKFLKNYWVLRRENDSGDYILGETIMPFWPTFEDKQHNTPILLELLNSGDCFDVVLDLQENDILELHFTCEGQKPVYAFAFNQGNWDVTDYDPFENADKVDAGKIEHALL